MNSIEKLDIIKHIKLGTSEVFYYPYNDGKEPLPIRPISSWELDECLYKALKHAPTKIAEIVIKYKLQIIRPDQNIDVSDEGYANLQKFYNSIDYWIVYHAMKDFQDEMFRMPNYLKEEDHPFGYYEILKMNDVHQIAEAVMSGSVQPKHVIKEIFKNESGQEMAYLIYYFKTPLADIKDITKLQRDYLVYSKGNIDNVIRGKQKKNKYVISGEKMTIEDLLQRFK